MDVYTLRDTVHVVFALDEVLKTTESEISSAMSDLVDIAAKLNNTDDEKIAKVYAKLKKTKDRIKGVLE